MGKGRPTVLIVINLVIIIKLLFAGIHSPDIRNYAENQHNLLMQDTLLTVIHHKIFINNVKILASKPGNNFLVLFFFVPSKTGAFRHQKAGLK